MLWLAGPVLLEQLLSLLVGLVDTWITAAILEKDAHLAAIGLMAYVLWLIPSMFAAVAIGATALVARLIGGRDAEMANRAMHQAVLVGGVFSVFATCVVYWGGGWFVRAMQLQGEAAPLATTYLLMLAPVVPAIMLEQVGIACLRGAGDTVSGFVVMSCVNVVNLIVSLGLTTGWGPFPNWGWQGLAIGTALSHALGGLLILLLLLRGRAGLKLRWRQMLPDADLISRLLRVGAPAGVDIMAILFCHLWFVAIINRLGVLPAAAHSLGIRIESLAYLPGTAFQVAAATLAGQFLGAGQPQRAGRSILQACAVGGGVMAAAGLVFFFGADALTLIFLGNNRPETTQLTVPLLQLVAFSMPSLALTMILTGGLRGAGDTRWPLAFTFIGYLCIRIPGAYWLAWEEIPIPATGLVIQGWGWGVLGAWVAMVADVSLRSLLVTARFWQGGWKKTRV